MSIATFDIDAIVRQVMADLGVTGASSPIALGSAKASKVATKKPVEDKKNDDKSKLHLLDSLVTLASLEGRLDEVCEVVITPNAVVTPSVRDLLYKKEIRLQISGFRLQEKVSIANPEARSPKPDEAWKVWLGLHDLKREPETLLNYLQGNASFVKTSFSCIIATVEAAVKQLCESQNNRAIIATNYAAAAMVLANRYASVRAIVGNSPEQTVQDAAQVGANLLVLSVDRLGAYRMREIARAFLTGQRQSPIDALIKAFAERGTK